MSRENVEIVRQLLEAVSRRDTATALDLYDPAVEMDFSSSPFADFVPGSGRFVGLEEVRAQFRNWYDAWDSIETDVVELVDAGEHVISVFSYRGRGRTSGIEVQWRDMAGLWTLKGGNVVKVAWLRDRAQAVAAAGVGE